VGSERHPRAGQPAHKPAHAKRRACYPDGNGSGPFAFAARANRQILLVERNPHLDAALSELAVGWYLTMLDAGIRKLEERGEPLTFEQRFILLTAGQLALGDWSLLDLEAVSANWFLVRTNERAGRFPPSFAS
jgi:hypothetical protein